jgi:hypothetical protein
MKIRTKLAILFIAVMLSLAGFGAIAGGLSVGKIFAATTPTTQVGVALVG